MKTKALLTIATAALAGLTLDAAPARAALMYVAGTSNVTLAPGQTATVTVGIAETEDGGLLGGAGLQQAYFGVLRDGGSSPAAPAAITGHTLNAAFAGEPFVVADSPAELAVALKTPMGATSGPTGPFVLLATLTVTGGASAGVTTFGIADDPSFDETVRFDRTALDALIAPGAFTVTTVVPEPVTLAALAGAGLVALRRRRA